MFCRACGAKNPDDSRFCEQCGERFSATNSGGGASSTAVPTAQPGGTLPGPAAVPAQARHPQPTPSPSAPLSPSPMWRTPYPVTTGPAVPPGPLPPGFGTQVADVDSLSFAAGDRITERYEVVQRLGAGGMGVVFQVHDRTLDQVVALKVLRPAMMVDDSARKRFLHEVRLTRDLVHPNIIRTFELGEFLGLFFFTMEFLEGRTLRQILIDQGDSAQTRSRESAPRDWSAWPQSACSAGYGAGRISRRPARRVTTGTSRSALMPASSLTASRAVSKSPNWSTRPISSACEPVQTRPLATSSTCSLFILRPSATMPRKRS